MYATVDMMVAKFGLSEVISLSDRERVGELNSAVVADALETATSEIEAYLAGRYALPLAAVPKVVAGFCCDMARFSMCGHGTSMTDEIRKRYDAAVSFFKLVARGDVTLGVTPAGAVPQSDDAVLFVPGTRVFGRDVR